MDLDVLCSQHKGKWFKFKYVPIEFHLANALYWFAFWFDKSNYKPWGQIQMCRWTARRCHDLNIHRDREPFKAIVKLNRIAIESVEIMATQMSGQIGTGQATEPPSFAPFQSDNRMLVEQVFLFCFMQLLIHWSVFAAVIGRVEHFFWWVCAVWVLSLCTVSDCGQHPERGSKGNRACC